MRALPSYLKVHAILLGCGLVSFLTFNLVVDPEDRFSLFVRPGFNQEKTEAMEKGGRVPKSRALERGRYDTVFLGTSRVENGLDPQHPVFTGQRVYNAGLGRTNFYEIYQVFDFVRKLGTTKTIVLGLDLQQFSGKRSISGDFLDSRFAGKTSWLSDIQYLASAQTFLASWTTVQKNRAGERSLYTAQGLRDRTLLYDPTHINHRDLFVKILTRNFLVSQETYGGFEYAADRLDLLRQLIAASRAAGISLHLFIAPTHARDLESLRVLGLYPIFEQWKRDLTRIIAEDAAHHPDEPPLRLWDFTGYTSLTTEDVPTSNERGKQMQWFWESSHFKKELGNLVLNRIFNFHDATHPIPEDFGVLLSSDTLEAHLARTREQQKRYHETHAPEVAEVEYLAHITSRFRAPKSDSQVASTMHAKPSPATVNQLTTSFFVKDTQRQ